MKTELLKLIGKGKLQEVISALLSNLLISDEDKVDIHLLEGRLTTLQNQKDNGIVSSSDERIERNSLAVSLSNYIKKLPVDEIKDNTKTPINELQIQEEITEKTPLQYAVIENILKTEDEYWLAVLLERPRGTEGLTLYYCRKVNKIIHFATELLIESDIQYDGYKVKVFDIIADMIPVSICFEKLFFDYEPYDISDLANKINNDLKQAQLNLLSILEPQQLMHYHLFAIKPLISELSALETLLKEIYENPPDNNVN